MKVILLEDVTRLGQKGDVKEVKKGYARNFLLRRNLVKPATPETLKEVEKLRAQKEIELRAAQSEFQTMIDKLNNITVVLEAKANEQGGLFRAITKKQIVSGLAKQGFTMLEEDDIYITEPIKKIGEYIVTIQRGNTSGKLKIVLLKKE